MSARRIPSRLVLVFLFTLLVSSVSTSAKESPDLSSAIDSILSSAFPAEGPGAAVIVTRDGKTMFRKGYGMADIEMGVRVEPDMVFRIGSVTKQFTAVAVMMLVEDGRLGLDDPITKFLPDYPTLGRTITIEHLLTHTSGIQSYTEQEQFIEMLRKDYTPQEMIDRFKNEPMAFDPGAKWRYNNSGYFLLGVIIEKASGMTWGDFLQKRIFDVVGMENTSVDDHSRIIAKRVEGYEPNPNGGWVNASWLSMTQPYAAGALVSTVDDLAKWDAALYTGTLIKPESLRRAQTSFHLNDGSPVAYGYGWAVGEWQGSPVIEHGGGINGFVCDAIRLPEQKAYVAILTNRSGVPGTGEAAQRIAALIMGKPWEPRAVDVAPEILKRYEGVYRIDEETTRTVTFESGSLHTQRTGGVRTKVFPMSETEFFYEDSLAHIEIEIDDHGAPTGMTMYAMGGLPEAAVFTDEKPSVRTAIQLDPSKLDRYLGRYELVPGFVLDITRDGDQLWAQATNQPKFEIFPESETMFFLKVVDAQIEFALDAAGVATSITLHQGGQNLPGKKLE